MFEWGEFLVLAEDLASRSNDEAAGRSAISRAYYATFHAGRAYLRHQGIVLNRGRFAHTQVQDELRKHNKVIADDVGRLQAWRKQADYDDPCEFEVRFQASTAVKLARITIGAIRALA